MRRRSLAEVLVSGGLLALLVTGCGQGDGGVDGGVSPREPCNQGGSCAADEVCDLAGGACVKSCGKASECMSVDAPRCDVAGRRCVGCVADEDCDHLASGEIRCDRSAGRCMLPHCNLANVALGPGGGPDACLYGEYCAPVSVCAAAAGSCDAASAYRLAHGDPVVSGASPVAHDVVAGAERDAVDLEVCATLRVMPFSGRWYDPQGDVPVGGLVATSGKIFFVTAAGAAGRTFHNTSITRNVDGVTGSFTFELCTDVRGNAEGVYLVDDAGNPSNLACYVF